MPCRGMVAAGGGEGYQHGWETQARTHRPPQTLSSRPTCEEVVTVLPQLLGLSVEAAGAAAGGGGQPLAQCLEGCPALGDTEDHDWVVLHVVKALNG